MPDVYATIAEADHELQERLATVLELRAVDPQQREMLDDYTALLELPPGTELLEVGCGTGAISRFLATLPGVAHVTGVDPSPLFVERARELAGDGPWSSSPATAASWRSTTSASTVVFHTSLCHMPECERALAEARRVLRPGGRLAVFDGDYATMTMALDATIRCRAAPEPCWTCSCTTPG